jgi:hypothetical protein
LERRKNSNFNPVLVGKVSNSTGSRIKKIVITILLFCFVCFLKCSHMYFRILLRVRVNFSYEPSHSGTLLLYRPESRAKLGLNGENSHSFSPTFLGPVFLFITCWCHTNSLFIIYTDLHNIFTFYTANKVGLKDTPQLKSRLQVQAARYGEVWW